KSGWLAPNEYRCVDHSSTDVMKHLALASLLLSATVLADEQPPVLNFDQAAALAAESLPRPIAGPLPSEIAALRRSVLPSVRAELSANASRIDDLLRAAPVDTRSATEVIAFDYPLWTGGLTRARMDLVEAKLRRFGERRRLDDARFTQLLDLFGQLYLAQRQSEYLRPIYDRLTQEANRSALLVSSGEMSNLAASEWTDIALAFKAQLLDLETRHIDAASKLQLL